MTLMYETPLKDNCWALEVLYWGSMAILFVTALYLLFWS
jgi:hypothetical protein